MTQPTIDKQPFAVDLKMVWGAAAVIAYLVYQGTTRLNAIEANIARIQDAPAQVKVIDDRQRETDSAVKELQKSQKQLAERMESIGSDVRAIGQQVTSIGEALRNKR